MSDYLYHPRSKDLYQQSLKALTCPHTRLVWGMVAKRAATSETWLAGHIEKCEQCRSELNLALEEEKFLATHIPFGPIDSEFSAELEVRIGREYKKLVEGQNKVIVALKLFGASLLQLASKRVFWFGLLFFALLSLKLASVNL